LIYEFQTQFGFGTANFLHNDELPIEGRKAGELMPRLELRADESGRSADDVGTAAKHCRLRLAPHLD
jgi:hypothetical protein